MKLETAKRLHDARHARREIRQFRGDIPRAALLQDRGLCLIIHKLIEIVGESLRQAEHTDPEMRTRIPEFRRIIDNRNRIVPGYDSVDYGLR